MITASDLASRPPILIKLVGRVPDPTILARQLSRSMVPTEQIGFVFDPDARDYDWYVVYDNLPSQAGERFAMRREDLACPRENTILLTSEPSSIKIYDRAFLRQFGHVISSQEPWAIRHPGYVYSQSGMRWYYGLGKTRRLSVDDMIAAPPLAKTRMVSTICSSKSHGHTLHRKRLRFSFELKRFLPELDLFGHGIRPMDDKAEALDPYRYHVAVENHRSPHHWTEKLADAFLGCTLPFYFGAPNAADYFPPESFVPIDIDQPEETAARIRAAIESEEYERRLPFILDARRRVIEEYNMIPLVANLAKSADRRPVSKAGGVIVSQRAARFDHPFSAMGDRARSVAVQLRNRWVE
jgi:hypothetical protein